MFNVKYSTRKPRGEGIYFGRKCDGGNGDIRQKVDRNSNWIPTSSEKSDTLLVHWLTVQPFNQRVTVARGKSQGKTGGHE